MFNEENIKDMIESSERENYSKSEVSVLIQLTRINSKIDNLTTTIHNHNLKIDNYKKETDKVLNEIKTSIKELELEYKAELKELEKRIGLTEKFNYKVAGALVVLSLLWSVASRYIVSFITQ